MLSWLLLLSLMICICVALAFHKWRILKYLGHLPTYPYLPILGNMHLFMGGGERAYEVLKEVSEIMERTRSPFLLWAGLYPVVAISNPAEAKIVTNTFIEKPYFYDFGKVWLGDGLVTAPGPVWKKNIKKIAGAFTRNILNGYQNVFNVQARQLVAQLKLRGGAEPFDAMPYLTHITLEAICQTALGSPQITNTIVTEEYLQAFTRVAELLIERVMNLFYHSEIIYRHTPAYRELKKKLAILHNVSDTVIRNRKRERESMINIKSSGPSCEHSGPMFKSFLDILLDMNEIGGNLSEQQIKSEVDTIIVGGQETVATTLFFTLLVIGSRKDVQEQLYKEVNEILGNSKRDISKEDLDKMIYCECLIYETLRLYPPVTGVLRQADRDLELDSCTIPKGATCFINAFAEGRSMRLWGNDALEYKPERWRAAENRTPPIMAFSIGRRSCIGKKYAITFLKTILAHCIRELTFTSNMENVKFKVDVMLKPYSGHFMQVQLRDSSLVL